MKNWKKMLGTTLTAGMLCDFQTVVILSMVNGARMSPT